MEMKRVLVAMLVLASCLMCGCENKQQVIELHTREAGEYHTIIRLKEGYWVRDYQIDYDGMRVVLNLEEE